MARKFDCGIYRITHIPSGQTYIGQSAAMRSRWAAHKAALRNGVNANRAMLALGQGKPDEFSFSVLVVCDVADLDYYERAAILAYRPQLNSASNRHTVNNRQAPARWNRKHFAPPGQCECCDRRREYAALLMRRKRGKR